MYRVLLVDQATFPSDTMSTHHIQRSGLAFVKRWASPATHRPRQDAR
jgi:hypothetical protein